MKLARIIALSLSVLLIAALPALASGGEKIRSGDTLIIRSDEVIPHDLYLTGSNIAVNGTVEGDLVVMGGQVSVRGLVTGDLWAAAVGLEVTGEVEGDARVMAGTARFAGNVGEDLLVAGNTFVLGEGARVGEDLFMAAGRAEVLGDVAGRISGSASSYLRQGQVGGSERVRTAPQEEVQWPLVDSLRMLASLLIVGALMALAWPQRLAFLTRTGLDRPAASLGWGLLSFAGIVIASLGLILATVVLAVISSRIGLPGLSTTLIFGGIIGTVTLIFAFVVGAAYISRVITGLALGKIVTERLAAPDIHLLVGLALGLILITLASLIPVAGGAILFLATAFGLGAILIGTWRSLRSGG